MELFTESDQQFEFFMGDEFKPWYEELEAVQFLEEIEAQEIKANEERIQQTGKCH